jgi:hypothetical protein
MDLHQIEEWAQFIWLLALSVMVLLLADRSRR